MDSEFHIYTLEKHQTQDINDSHVNGELTVLWRDWDKIINIPKMIYVNTIEPLAIKGPHIHKKRTSYFFCMNGKIVVVIKDSQGNYHEILVSSNESKLIEISSGTPAAIVNPSPNMTSRVLVLADIAWKPDDNEMENTNFTNYDWNKWKDNDGV